MEDWVKRMVGRAYRPTCCICGCDIHMGSFGAAKRDGAGAVFWHDRCYMKRYGKTPEQYEAMERVELQTELKPEEYEQLESMGGRRMAKTKSIWALVFENGKVWRERRDGYITKTEGLFVCKTSHLKIKGKPVSWEAIDEGSGLRLIGPFGTKRECEAALTDEVTAKLLKHRENSAWRAAVRLNELVYARGSMPVKEYNQFEERYKAEELDKFKQQMKKEEDVGNGYKQAPRSEEPVVGNVIESLKGERVCITGTLAGMTRQEAFIRLKGVGGVPCERFNGKVTLFVIAANSGRDKRKKADAAIAKGQALKVVDGTTFIEALERDEAAAKARAVEQMAARKGMSVKATVGKESGGVTPIVIEPPKAPAKPKAAEKKEEALDKRIEELEKELKATRKELEDVWKENERLKAMPKREPKPKPKADVAVTVSLKAMQEWCEGKGLIATQKREGTCIWVEGESTPYRDELVEMGFRFAKKRKSWYYNPAA